ncbi:MAG: hypothetical protein SNJ56_06315 [Termitinemataceae bacterium]
METQTNDPARFWREYEQRYGERVLAHALGCYMNGWEEFSGPLWGLLIATDGGFRFHHFPQEGWIQLMSRMSGGGAGPTEKTIYIPLSQIVTVQLYIEGSWLRKLFTAAPPRLVLQYLKSDGSCESLFAETDKTALSVVEALQGALNGHSTVDRNI